MRLAGVDGCRGGWVVASADELPGALRFAVVADLDDLFRDAAAGRTVVAIDIPIGLPETGDRACDRAARRLLGFPRGTSVFPAPCRAALAGSDYQQACRLNAAACGRRLTIETYHILPWIRSVDRLISPALQAGVRECHPEVAFAVLAGIGRGLMHTKKTQAGEAERLALLARVLPALDVAAARAALGPARVARNDVIDAAVCLVAAARISVGAAIVLPEGDIPLDGRGLRMEIVA